MPQLTTAFLGVAHIHTPGFISMLNKRTADVSVKYVYDPDAARGQMRAGELPGASFVPDPAAIFNDPDIGSVVICSETRHHLQLVMAAARAGKHIFCEKPLGLGASDATAMADAIKAAGVTFQTGFFQRGSPFHQFLHREVTAGHLGKVTRARFSNGHSAALANWFNPEWMWLADAQAAGGGAFLDLGAHILDIALHVLTPTEGDVTQTACVLGNKSGQYGTSIDEYGTGLLTFQSGASCVLEASWVDPMLHSPTDVFGTEGQVQEMPNGDIFYYSKHVDGADGKTPVADLPQAAPHAFELFWDALSGKDLPVPLVTVDEALHETVVMEQLYQSAGRSTTTGL